MKTTLFILPFIFSVSAFKAAICDDFTNFNWQTNGDTLGYTQNNIYPVLNVPYFNDTIAGGWDVSQNFDEGMYGITSGVQFSFDGSNQFISLEIYGFYGQYHQMGFSVNGSSPINLSSSFPMTIGAITVDLDTTAPNSGGWEYAYLTFSGNVQEVEYYAFEAGVVELCVSNGPIICDDFTQYNWSPSGDTLGYTQNGTSPIIEVPGNGSPYWDFNQGYPGLFGAYAGAQFSFNGNNQIITLEVYYFEPQANLMEFTVNGSAMTTLASNFPMMLNGVTVDLDTTAADLQGWENAYLIFTGNVQQVVIYPYESGMLELCVEDNTTSGITYSEGTKKILFYPNPTSAQLNIQGVDMGKVEIMNMQGQTIWAEQVTKDQHSLDVSHLPNGMYIASIQIGSKIITQRFVKQ